MGSFAKWIAGGLGWAFFGPVGGIFGFLLGSMFDGAEKIKIESGRTTPGDYAISLLVLITAMLKADGRILRSELDFVKSFLVNNFGKDGAKEALAMLKDLLKQEIPIQDVCSQISNHVNYSSRLQLLHFLFGLGYADGRLDKNEEKLLEIIANSLHIEWKDRDSIKSMFKNTIEDYYKILEIDSTVPDEEVKKAYRRMAMKYHPDKVSTMGEDIKRAAHEKFQKLNHAYEQIKKERSMV